MNRSELQIRIDELADEFLQRRRDGENPKVEEFANAHPEIATPLRQFLRTILMVDDIRDETEFKSNPGFSPQTQQDAFPKLEDYEVIREIGRGGMGIVYEAHHLSLDRTVALKVLPAGMFQNQGAVKRFQLEAKSAARLHHTNIVPIFDVDQTENSCYYAMQYIEGQSLDYVVNELKRIVGDRSAVYTEQKQADEKTGGVHAQIVRRQSKADLEKCAERTALENEIAERSPTIKTSALSDTMKMGLSSTSSGRQPFYRNVARIGKQAAEALHHAHENGIVHRDIKPANMLLDFAGTIWIMDFGLAKTDDGNLTQTGDVVGTLRYMSPERFAGQCDRRSDVYSLGITLYELLSQRPAFGNTDRLSLMDSIKTSEPESLRKLDRNIPRDLETIVEKAIEKDPRRRYATANDMASDLNRFMTGLPIHARRVGNAERLWLWARKRKALATSLAALSTLLIAGTIASVVAAKYYRDLADLNLSLAQSNADQTVKAQQRAEEATRAKQKAETSQERTNDVLQLVTNAFESVNPESGANADMLARDVLLELERSLTSSTLDDEGRLQVLDKLTRCYLAIGEPQSALSAAEEYFQLSKSVLGDDDDQTIGARELLAQMYKLSGRLDEAVSLFEYNMEAMKTKPGWRPEDSIIPVGNLAKAYFSAGRRDEALALLEEIVPLAKTHFGENDPTYLSLLKSRAISYQQMGQFDKAIPQFEEALEKCRTVLGEDHPDTLDSMNSLAVAYDQNGQFEEAVSLSEQTLTLMRRKLGEDHGDTLNVMSNLVVAYNSVRRTDEAIALGERTIELIRAKFGETHPNNVGALNALALAYNAAGRYEDAIKQQESLVSILEGNLGASHPNTLVVRGNLANSYGKVERRSEELELREENLRLSRTAMGEDHPATMTGMQNLAGLYANIGRTEEAVEMLEKVLRSRRRIYGDGHVQVQSSMHSLAVAYQRNGQLPAAIDLMEQTLDLRRQTLGENHPRTLSVMVGLGTAYMDSDRMDEGIPLLERALESSRTSLGDRHPQTLITMHSLSGYLIKVGRLAEAEQLLAENVEAQKAINPNAWMTFNVETLYGSVLRATGKFDKAETALTNAHAGLSKISIPKGREGSFEEILLQLKKLAEARGQTEVADKWQRALDAITPSLMTPEP